MHIHALDTYRPGSSLVHRLDARVKLVVALLLILTAVLLPEQSWLAYGLLQALLLGVTIVSRVGVGLVQRRAAVALPFTLAALTVVFVTPGQVLFSIPVPGGAWAVSDAGLLRFLSIVVRSYLSIQAAVLLAATTPFPALLQAMRALGIPRTLVAIGSFLYRYLFVLADEAQRLLRAREARSALPRTADRVRRPGRSLPWRACVTGGMAGSLFIRSYERSERIYTAMLARGYDGEIRSFSLPAMRAVDWLWGAAAILTLAVILILSRWGVRWGT